MSDNDSKVCIDTVIGDLKTRVYLGEFYNYENNPFIFFFNNCIVVDQCITNKKAVLKFYSSYRNRVNYIHEKLHKFNCNSDDFILNDVKSIGQSMYGFEVVVSIDCKIVDIMQFLSNSARFLKLIGNSVEP